jgi:hypothetical protein
LYERGISTTRVIVTSPRRVVGMDASWISVR